MSLTQVSEDTLQVYIMRLIMSVRLNLTKNFNSWPSFSGNMVVGCPFTIDAISALAGFLGNRF